MLGVEGVALRPRQATHGRAPRARLLADPPQPPAPVRDGFRPRAPPAAGRRRDARQGDERRDLAEAPVRGRRPREAARDGPHRLGAHAARLGLLPRRHGPGPPLPARRRSGDGRRRVGDPRDRGQRLHDRDVHRSLRPAAACAWRAVRARLRDR